MKLEIAVLVRVTFVENVRFRKPGDKSLYSEGMSCTSMPRKVESIL